MPQPHNPFAGETPFPLAGEGVVLKFTMTDLAGIHSLYGPDVRRPPDIDPRTGQIIQSFWSTILGWISVHDPVVINNVLRLGLKERDENGKLRPIRRDPDWWDSPPFSLSEVADQIEAGLMWSHWGMTPDELAAKIREQADAAREAADENPTMPNGTESPSLSAS